MALDILKDAWSPIHPVDFMYVRSEFNPLAIAIVPPTDVVITVNIEVELEQESTTLTLCTPYSTIEPLRGKLVTGFQSTRLEADTGVARRIEKAVRETMANVSVQLASGAIKAKNLLALKQGDIMMMDTNPHDEALVKIEGEPKLYGYIGTRNGNKALRMTRAIPKQDLIDYYNREELLKTTGK